MLDVLSVCPVGCLLLLLVRPHPCPFVLMAASPPPPPGSLLIACSRVIALSSPSVLLLTAVVCPHPPCPFVLMASSPQPPPGSLLIACSRLPMLSFLPVCPVVSCLLLLLGGVACCQLSPVSLSFAVTIAVLSVCLVSCTWCSSSAAARLSAVGCHHRCPLRLSCSLQVLHDLSHHPSLYCLSPSLSSPSILLLGGVAFSQLPPGSLLFAVDVACAAVAVIVACHAFTLR